MFQKSHYILILISALGLFGFEPATAQSPHSEQIVTIQYRTYGWNSGVQEYDFKSESHSVTVFARHFSKKQLYTGPRLMRFYDSDTGAQIAEGLLPQSMDKLLLLFVTAPKGAKFPLQVFFIDDSLTNLQTQNVHFYNLSRSELVVKTLDNIQKVGPAQQSRWDLNSEDKISSIAIAVTQPIEKVLYSNRYRLLADQRLIFFARKRGQNKDGTPRLQISYVIEKVLEETN